MFSRYRLATLILLAALAFILQPAKAQAACTSPVAAAGDIIYNSTGKTFQYCNDTNWIRMNTPGTGSGGCTSPTIPEGQMVYNADARVLQGCAGNVQRAMGPVGGATGNKWKQVNSGSSHSCGIKNDGTLWCWGSDGTGNLGNGATTGNQVSPVQESTAATNWQSVSAGSNHTCAIKTNGTLWCWGGDLNGQLGNGATTGNQVSPVQESMVAANWQSVSAGNSHTCAIKTTGTLWCWGFDNNGQIGNGATTGDQVSPVQESTAATNWQSVSAGSNHTCAIKTNGTLWCWGFDNNGQIGNGATTGDQISPVQESTAATNWTTVSSGGSHTCAMKTNSTLWCWGDDGSGQIGNGATTGNQISPVQESTAAINWTSLSTSSANTCALKGTGTLWCWGSDSNGQMGNGATTGNQISPVQESTTATNWQSLSVGGAIVCAIKNNGMLWCWGADSQGQLGNGSITGDQASPVQESTTATDWQSVSASGGHTCAVKANGTLWCWGSDSTGQLGNGATTGNQVIAAQESTAAANWRSVSAGGGYTCAVKTDGTIWCWGSDSNGQLGNGATTGDQISPVQESTAATNWQSVSAASTHTCAVKTNGTLWCWGSDGYGELGNGATTGDQISPVQESSAAANWLGVSAAGSGFSAHTCAVKTTGTLWCWGSDSNGQLGNGATAGNQISPVQESTAAINWTNVSTTGSMFGVHTCAVKANGTLWCWGSDSYGELGNGATTGTQISPVQESSSDTNWQSVSSGSTYTCAIKTTGSVWCWGEDTYGQLGNGATSGDQISPVSISFTASQISAGYSSACAISSGKISCWGSNNNGQLGISRPLGDSPLASNICYSADRKDKGPGSIVYNATANVLQYCDGAGWVGIRQ